MPRKLLFKRDADFNINNAESLLKWACWLKGKKLKDSLDLLPENHQRIALNELEKISKATILPDGTYKGPKGKLGILVEVIHFGLSPDNAAEADLKDAGLELKVTGVIKNKNGIRAKERLSLGMIDYRRSVLEKTPFENDIEIQKSLSGMLIMTYWYKARTTNPLDLEFNDSFIWKPKGEEREMIKRDWALHQATIRCGYAHMLTERYSNGLGAPPKGAGGNSDFIKQYTPIPHSYGQLKNEFIELGVEEDQADYLVADYKVRMENPGDGKKGFATPEKSDKTFELGPFPARRRCYSLTNAYLTKLVKLRAEGKI